MEDISRTPDNRVPDHVISPNSKEQIPVKRIAPKKGHLNSIVKFILFIVIVALCSGGVYYWQHQKYTTLNTKVSNLNQQVSDLNVQLQASKTQVMSLQTELTKNANDSVATCSLADLTVTGKAELGGAAGNDYDTLVFTNISSKPCTLDGYPTITMLNSSHTSLDIPTSHGGGMILEDPGTNLIGLNPGGTAVSGISVTEGGQVCYTPAYLQVSLPDSANSYTLTAGSAYDLCTSYTVTAFQSGSNPKIANSN